MREICMISGPVWPCLVMLFFSLKVLIWGGSSSLTVISVACNISRSLVVREMRIINDNKITGSALPHLPLPCYEAKLYQNRLDLAGPGTIVIISRGQTICRPGLFVTMTILCWLNQQRLFTPHWKSSNITGWGVSLSPFYQQYWGFLYILKFTYIRFCKILRIWDWNFHEALRLLLHWSVNEWGR